MKHLILELCIGFNYSFIFRMCKIHITQEMHVKKSLVKYPKFIFVLLSFACDIQSLCFMFEKGEISFDIIVVCSKLS